MNDGEFTRLAERMGVPLSRSQVSQFRRYEEHLGNWSQRVRLVSHGDRHRLRERHLLTSLAAVPFLKEAPISALDLGTGAGLPGIPIKIARPDIRMTLLEPARMKALFLHSVREAMGIPGLEVVRARAEEIAQDNSHRGAYDAILARAVAGLPRLWEMAAPLLKEQGRLLAFKRPGGLAEFGDTIPPGLVAEELILPEAAPGRRSALILVSRPHASQTP